MSTEETQEVEATETETADSGVVEQKKTLAELSQEELVDYVKTLRAENAKHRTGNKQKEAELEEFRQWKDSQKSELQRATERAERAEAERLEVLRTNAALAAGLDEDLSEFITGSTPEEIKASAQKLAGKTAVPRKGTASDVFAGTRGTPVSEGPKDPKQAANDYMARLIFGSGR